MEKRTHNFLKGLGIFFAVAAGIGTAVLGYVDRTDWIQVAFYSVAVVAIVLWGWHFFLVRWSYQSKSGETKSIDDDENTNKRGLFWDLIARNWIAVTGFLLLLGLFILLCFLVPGFFSGRTVVSAIILLGFLILAFIAYKFLNVNKSVIIGVAVLVGLFIIGSVSIDGFLSLQNIKSMLVFASFLGLATIGQTLVVMLGGLDLSIPFLIGATNLGLMSLISLGVPPWLAFIVILAFGTIVGLFNGLISFNLQGQALIVTLGVGFMVVGGVQILVSLPTVTGGTVFGVVPNWLKNLASLNGKFFGLPIPPVILIWILVSILLIVGLRHTKWGRNLYAVGGKRLSADRLSISERAYWVGVYVISGFTSAATGAMLLGWSGGGFIGVGDQYLFLTVAAVAVGGTSLLGGYGGYGFTVIGVLALQVISTFLAGLGLSFEGQQFIFGLLILPLVALYSRAPHIREQI
jgi:ribose transport system permease protein|tara:strand:+ start:685 stop:2070 length:1386 start_codon:yes stop_codon:yes gene_type:complete